MNPYISIIIPVYNVEPYLEFCVKSLINQTLKELEFIFINDGSQDNSLSILKGFAKKDSRMVIIDQSNKGVSVARNNGIKAAKGKYIAFVDSDDWVEKDMYEVHYREIESSNCDVILSNIKSNYHGFEQVERYTFPLNVKQDFDFIKNTILPHLVRKDDMYSSCNKLFKTAIIKNNNILFPAGNALSEDNIFNMLYFNNIKTFKYIDYSGYNYRTVDGSATRNILEQDYFKNALRIFNFDYKFFMDLNLTDEELHKLKSEKLIKTVLSLINIYLSPSKTVKFGQRYSYVKTMIKNIDMQNALKKNFNHLMHEANRFDKIMLKAVKRENMLTIVLASKYSLLKNRK